MNKLIWVYDSPYSRSIKWLLCHHNVAHEDHVLTWEQMATDKLLASNPKRQVPTLWSKSSVKIDSLLIALEYLTSDWYQSVDAKFFRLADSDVEAAIIFLFRARLLRNKFGSSEHSQFMLQAGIDTYKQSVDYLLDHLLSMPVGIDSDEIEPTEIACNYGSVLLISTLFAAISLAKDELLGYRREELTVLFKSIESDVTYQSIIKTYQGKPANDLPFEYSILSKIL